MKTEEIQEQTAQLETEVKHGWLYWFVVNTIKKAHAFMCRNKKVSIIFGVLLAWCAFVFRAYWQPYVVLVRVHTPECLYMGGLLALVWECFKHRRWKWSLLLVGVMSASVLIHFKMELPPLRHLTLYLRYRNLHPIDVAELPVTDHERIQPLNSIRILGSEAMQEVEHVSDPDFVRIYQQSGDEYRWTMAVEPAYTIPRFTGHIKQLMNVSGLAPSPNFSGENRVPVSFRVGEGLLMGKNTEVSTIRSLGLLRFFSYSPRDVKFLKDDNGEWVEVISLIRWRGIIFVWPEFGGVQVVRQGQDDIWSMIKSWFLGDGEWIPPEKIVRHPYLAEQNTVPYEVSRFMAMSLRFQNGFWSPAPWYHKGDIRIPDLPGDENDQPFTAYFRFDTKKGKYNKLYHYFALEPYHDTKQGLNTSLFVPADGIGPVKIYRHYRQNEALTGVSAIAAKVMESRKEYDWEQSRPVEHRPYIRDIGGKRRFFWLTTVVTYKDKKHAGERGFIAGSTPAVTLTDALYKNVVWVNPHDTAKWESDLRTKLEVVWKSN